TTAPVAQIPASLPRPPCRRAKRKRHSLTTTINWLVLSTCCAGLPCITPARPIEARCPMLAAGYLHPRSRRLESDPPLGNCDGSGISTERQGFHRLGSRFSTDAVASRGPERIVLRKRRHVLGSTGWIRPGEGHRRRLDG